MVYISLMTNFSLPLAAIGLFASTTGLLEYTEFLVSQSWGRRLSFFIPQTSTAITDLDQTVALASGIMTLGFSMWDVLKVMQAAIRGERDREEELDRRIGIEMDRLARMREIALTQLSPLLEDVQNQLDQSTEDSEERRHLLARRQQLRHELLTLWDKEISSEIPRTLNASDIYLGTL